MIDSLISVFKKLDINAISPVKEERIDKKKVFEFPLL
jgi:hypothetical protein